MSPAGKAVLDALIAEVEWPVRRAVERRYSGMSRELEYLFTMRNNRVAVSDAEIVQSEGWSLARVDVLCALNAFYQIVLGPQGAASRKFHKKELANLEVAHGSSRFDEDRATATRMMIYEFERRFANLGFQSDVATAPTAGSLLFRLANRFRE